MSAAQRYRRVLLDRPVAGPLQSKAPWRRGRWDHESEPIHWVSHPEAHQTTPFFAAYRLQFSSHAAETVRLHLTADERYIFYIDGELIDRGSERGDLRNWYFESFDLDFEAGEHTISFFVFSLGDRAAGAQISLRHGLFVAAEGENTARFSTGIAPWQTTKLEGISLINRMGAMFASDRQHFDGSKFDLQLAMGLGRRSLGLQSKKTRSELASAETTSIARER